MSNYIGYTPDNIYSSTKNRFFYGLRRTDQGELFSGKIDQFKDSDSLTINIPGDQEDNFNNFEEGQNFNEGRDVNHNLVYPNLKYEQYHWDDRNILYYVNDEGELVARVNQPYTYDDSISTDGL